MNLNIREMIAGPPTRLRYVFRYSTTRVSHPESVAEHSYYVAFYSMLIARWVDERGYELTKHIRGVDEPYKEIDTVNLLQRALLHDLEEAISGDFPRPFKHSSLDLKEMLQKASQKAFEQVIEPVTGKQTIDEDSGLKINDEVIETYDPNGNVTDEYICSWLDAKDGTLEGRILEFADFLAVLSFMIQEGASNGNQLIHNHIRNMEDYFAIFKAPNYDFIRPLVNQAQLLMDEVFPKSPMKVIT